MAKILGLKHTDGRIIVVDWTIGNTHFQFEENESEREANIRAYMFQDLAQYMRFKNKTNTQFEKFTRPPINFTVPNVVSKLTAKQVSTDVVSDGERLNHLVHNFVFAKANAKEKGWVLVYES